MYPGNFGSWLGISGLRTSGDLAIFTDCTETTGYAYLQENISYPRPPLQRDQEQRDSSIIIYSV